MILITLVKTEQIDEFFKDSSEVTVNEACKVVYENEQGETLKFINEEGGILELVDGYVSASELGKSAKKVKAKKDADEETVYPIQKNKKKG